MPLHDAKTGDWQGRRGSRQKINNSKTQSIKKAKGERRAHSRCPQSYLALPAARSVGRSFGITHCTRHLCIDLSIKKKKKKKKKIGVQMLCLVISLVATAYGAERCRHARPRHPTPAVVEIAQHFQGFRNVLLYLIHSAQPRRLCRHPSAMAIITIISKRHR